MMNPLFPRITVEECQENFDFILTLVERGTSFYIEDPETQKTVLLLPIKDPVAQLAMQQDKVKSIVDEAFAEMYSDGTTGGE